MTREQSERRLGITIFELLKKAKPLEKVLRLGEPEVKYNLQDTREKVYGRIVEYLEVEGYPMTTPDFKEANISDLVFTILSPIILDFGHKSNRAGTGMMLVREKEIVSVDSETGGQEEFIVMDIIPLTEKKFVLVIEAKKTNLVSAMKQLLLSLKDMRDRNGQGMVYGFTTTGDCWQMVIYDGSTFEVTEDFKVMFPSMKEDKEVWLKGYSVLVDCTYFYRVG
ncbi:hypothetical protein BGX38DRAFT_1271102 [Terfezia claveryi]|nr:hypothetical protein BGX38DRAFT_1271102 [Terfezia claveryi]